MCPLFVPTTFWLHVWSITGHSKWNIFVLTISVIIGRLSLFLRHLSLGQCWLRPVDECIWPVVYPKIEEQGCWHRLSLHMIQVAFWLESSLMFSHKNTTYCPRFVLEPRLINLESIALTMRSPSLPQRCKQFGCKIQGENGFQKVRVAKVLLSTKTIQCIRFNLFETVNCVMPFQ